MAATRSELKRQSITEAASRLFLAKGYQGASMDDVAGAAGVSKQTVYKHFQDKEKLFSDVILGITERADEITRGLRVSLAEVQDLEPDLIAVAVNYAKGVVNPDVIRLRRLVIAEAVHFPELAAAYFAQAPQRGLTAVAEGLQSLVDRDLLAIKDADLAASQFAYLVLGPLIDQALLLPGQPITSDQIQRCSVAGVAMFLESYSRR